MNFNTIAKCQDLNFCALVYFAGTNVKRVTGYREIFAPFRPRCQRANLRLGDSKSLKLFLLNFFKQICVWANSRQKGTCSKCRKAKKIHGRQ